MYSCRRRRDIISYIDSSTQAPRQIQTETRLPWLLNYRHRVGTKARTRAIIVVIGGCDEAVVRVSSGHAAIVVDL